MHYSEVATRTYGKRCEWIGCGWDEAGCDVHHLDYQEHNTLETSLRRGEEQETGKYGIFIDGQLPKNDSSDNLSVLCPNHHRFVHHADLGLTVLDYIPPRRKVDPNSLKLFRRKKK